MRRSPNRHFDRTAVLQVARAHSTRIAAEWAGIHITTVIKLRKQVDGYSRGRGHPSRAEMAAEAARSDCGCGFCADVFDVARRRPQIVSMLDDRYSPATIARVLRVPEPAVQAIVAERRRAVEQRWVAA